MSADSYTVCPKCHPDLIGWRSSRYRNSTASDHAAEELGYNRSIRENYEFYIENGDTLVASYNADCWDCGFQFDFQRRDLIPGLD